MKNRAYEGAVFLFGIYLMKFDNAFFRCVI